jgi:deaminated glutathione amidase
MKTLRVAIVQTNAGGDNERNLGRISKLTSELPRMDIIALPEVFAMRGSDRDYRKTAEPLDGRIVSEMAKLARKHHAWVLAGSVIEKAGRRIYNTTVLLNRAGKIAATYRKIHLFEAQLDNGKRICEAHAYDAGSTPVLVTIEGWRVGLAICYDLRFPELFRHYSKKGAHILFVPSNFTLRTGKDHWEVLVRARAIENQCFVVAPNQCGINPAIGVASYGHSMAVGPWGEVLCEAGTSETVLVTELNMELLHSTRQRVPALKHRVL